MIWTDLIVYLDVITVYLWFDVFLGDAVGVEPGGVDLAIKMADVAHDRVFLEHGSVMNHKISGISGIRTWI